VSKAAASVALERIIGRNDLIGVEFLTAAVTAARSVGRVLVRTRAGRVVAYGSGALVSPRLFLTNNHVLDAAASAASSVVEFGYEYAPGGRLQPARTFALTPDEFFLTDPALDFTLVAVKADGGLTDFGWLTLNDDDGAVLKDEYVNIVQHPSGRPKQVAIRDNLVTDILPDFLHYRADTEPGSSGAPVFNDQWELIGLHHSGAPKRNDQGQILAHNGAVWTDNMGDAAIDWIANEGIRVGRILTYLKGATLPDTLKPARDELLSAVISRSQIARPAAIFPAEEGPMPTDQSRVEHTGTSGTPSGVTVNVPVHISISSTGLRWRTSPSRRRGPCPRPPFPPAWSRARRSALTRITTRGPGTTRRSWEPGRLRYRCQCCQPSCLPTRPAIGGRTPGRTRMSCRITTSVSFSTVAGGSRSSQR
jgi:hypothetical protein